MKYEEKVQKLNMQMRRFARQDIAVAFSGGADSSLLLKLAVDAAAVFGSNVYGIFMHTMLHPAGEAEEARMLAEKIGAKFCMVSVDELQGAGILDNPADRCYRCKKYLFEQLLRECSILGVSVVLEGTNGDDLHVYRPGLRAVRELGILSPLADAEFTKAEVRKLGAKLGISASEKPASPCLATRFPYGTRLSSEAMRKVEQGERFIREKGFYNVRLRVHGDLVRIEVDIEEFQEFMKEREAVTACLKALGYRYITLDLEGFRSGSMDISLSHTR